MTTPNIGLSEVPSNILQPSVPINDAFQLIDALLPGVVQAITATPPTTLAADAGKVWIVGDDAVGAWAGNDGRLAISTAPALWRFVVPQVGWRFDVGGLQYRFDGEAWMEVEGSGTPDDNSVTNAKIVDGAVTAAKLASDVAEFIRDTMGTALVAGTGISITVSDPGDTITITNAGGYTDEQAQDAMAAAFEAGTHSGISFAYDDAVGAISATVTAAGSGDVSGPSSATDDAIALFNGTTGKAVKDSGVTVASLRSLPQNSKSAAYTLVLGDAGGHVYHPSADTTARAWTIPANSAVPFPIGTAVTFVNDTGAGAITISITTDTLVLAGAGSTGSRTLAPGGVATALKVAPTRWIISGAGLN